MMLKRDATTIVDDFDCGDCTLSACIITYINANGREYYSTIVKKKGDVVLHETELKSKNDAFDIMEKAIEENRG